MLVGRGADEDGAVIVEFGSYVTRAELALFMARINTGIPARDADGNIGWFEQPSPGAASVLSGMFDDGYQIPEWAAGAVLYCVDEGYFEMGGLLFEPERAATLGETLLAMLRALGRGAAMVEFGHGSGEDHTLLDGFIEGFADDLERELTRGELIMMLYNFLNSEAQVTGMVFDPETESWVMIDEYRPVRDNFRRD